MKRGINESYEDYKIRRNTMQEGIGKYLKGKWLWRSKCKDHKGIVLNKGTYIKNKEE